MYPYGSVSGTREPYNPFAKLEVNTFLKVFKALQNLTDNKII